MTQKVLKKCSDFRKNQYLTSKCLVLSTIFDSILNFYLSPVHIAPMPCTQCTFNLCCWMNKWVNGESNNERLRPWRSPEVCSPGLERLHDQVRTGFQGWCCCSLYITSLVVKPHHLYLATSLSSLTFLPKKCKGKTASNIHSWSHSWHHLSNVSYVPGTARSA